MARVGAPPSDGHGPDPPSAPGEGSGGVEPRVPDAATLAVRYDRDADRFAEVFAPTLREAGTRLVEMLPPRAPHPAGGTGSHPGVVLDLGAGVGTLAPALAARFPGATLLGADRSARMLAQARGHRRAVMDAEALGLGSGRVNVVVAAFVLFHLQQVDRGLGEAARVLRPGGWFASVTWGGEFRSPMLAPWEEALAASGAPPRAPGGAAVHDPTDSPGKLTALLRAAGFTDVRAHGHELVAPLTPEEFLDLKTGFGDSRTRFEALGPEARRSCLARARTALERLDPGATPLRSPLVFAVARRPD